MNNEVKTIKLSNCEVDLKTEITWGESQKIKNAMVARVKFNAVSKNVDFDESIMSEEIFVAMEVFIKEIREGEKKFGFTREWMNGLSVSDGDKLVDEVNKISKKKEN